MSDIDPLGERRQGGDPPVPERAGAAGPSGSGTPPGPGAEPRWPPLPQEWSAPVPGSPRPAEGTDPAAAEPSFASVAPAGDALPPPPGEDAAGDVPPPPPPDKDAAATATPPATPPWAPPPPPPPPTAPAPPTPAPAAGSADTPARSYGERMATGVLLTLAGGSAAAGGILALLQTEALSFTTKALICGGAAALLLAGAVVLRLVRGTDDLRGTLAVVGIAFATACLAFAYDPATASGHDNLVKFAIGAGIVAVLGWFACIAVPSAVAGLLAAIALPSAAGAGIWLGFTAPTHVQVYVTALGVGLVLAMLLPRLTILRPHPTGLGWTLAGAALAVTLPAVELITRGDASAIAAGATAAGGLLLLAQRHRHLPSALGALVGLAVLEGELISRYLGTAGSSSPPTTLLIAVAATGGVLVVLVAVAVLLDARGLALPRWPLPLIRPADVLLLAALALALVSLFTGPGDVPFNPPQLSSGSTATQVPATPPLAQR